MKNAISPFVLVSLILMGLLGCFWNKKPVEVSTTHSIKNKVTMIHYFSGTLSGGVLEMIRNFNQSHSGIELSVSSLDHEAFKTSILETLEKENPPDIYSYWAGARTRSILNQLSPLDSMWSQEKLDSQFSDSVIDSAVTYDGKKYLLPITQHYVGFYYNKKLFEAKGLVPPKTWTEFLHLCNQLKKSGVKPLALGAKSKWPAQFWFDYLLLRTAPLKYRNDLMNLKAHFTDPEVLRVFKLWSELVEKGFFVSSVNDMEWDSGAAELVFTGQAAMTLMGTWLSSYFSDAAHKWQAGTDFDFFSFPIIDEKIPKVALGPIDGFVVPAKSSNIKGALQVLAYLAKPENQKIMSQGSGALAPGIHVPADFYNTFQKALFKEIVQIPHWAFNYDLATPPKAAAIGLSSFAEFLEFPKNYKDTLKKWEAETQKLLTEIK